MFKFKYLSEELKAKLFNAVSLVITRATEPTKHLDQLTTIAKNFLKMPETIMCGDILERIVSSNRFEAFEQATLNQACPPLKILDNLDRKKWIFMNLSEVNNQFSKDETMRKLAKMKKLNVEVNNEEEIGPSTIISLPFKKDFLTLNKEKPNEVVIFNSKIRSRINSFNEFKKIANAFIKKCLVHLYVE